MKEKSRANAFMWMITPVFYMFKSPRVYYWMQQESQKSYLPQSQAVYELSGISMSKLIPTFSSGLGGVILRGDTAATTQSLIIFRFYLSAYKHEHISLQKKNLMDLCHFWPNCSYHSKLYLFMSEPYKTRWNFNFVRFVFSWMIYKMNTQIALWKIFVSVSQNKPIKVKLDLSIIQNKYLLINT